MYPLALTLKPPRSLRLLAIGLIIGAVLLLVLVPDRYAGMCALLMCAIALGFWRYAQRSAGGGLVLLADGRWRLADRDVVFRLMGSSARLAGVFWLHGVSDEGLRASIMVMPDALCNPSGYRQLCVWFNAARHRGG